MQLETFIGAEAKPLQIAIYELNSLLTSYYGSIAQNGVKSIYLKLPLEYDDKKKAYCDAVNLFKKLNHFDFIKNFFTILSEDYSKFESLFTFSNLMPAKTILVTDNLIKEWLEKNKVENDITDITPYEINRFLLHAMSVDPLQ